MSRLLIASLLALICTATKAEDQTPPPAPLTDQDMSTIAAAETTGRRIYLHDHAASVAFDAAYADPGFSEDRRVGGWITEEKDGTIVVTFLDRTPAAIYRATVSGDGEVVGGLTTLDPPAPLTELESGAAAARSLAMHSGFGSGLEPCSRQYNTVVLPSPDGDPAKWTVYLLPGTTKPDFMPFGGTYRVETDGDEIVSTRGFTRSCIAFPIDRRAVGLAITHLLDPTPTEAHVFWNLWSDMPMFVATQENGRIWSIEDGKIALGEQDTTAH